MAYKPDKYPQIIIHLTVRDTAEAIKFYTSAFSFDLFDSVPGEDGKIRHAEFKYKDVMVMIAPEGEWGDIVHKAPVTLGVASSSTFYMYVENVDSFYAHAIANGAKSVLEPQDSFWGDRFCRVVDEEGYEWMFATFIEEKAVA